MKTFIIKLKSWCAKKRNHIYSAWLCLRGKHIMNVYRTNIIEKYRDLELLKAECMFDPMPIRHRYGDSEKNLQEQRRRCAYHLRKEMLNGISDFLNIEIEKNQNGTEWWRIGLYVAPFEAPKYEQPDFNKIKPYIP